MFLTFVIFQRKSPCECHIYRQSGICFQTWPFVYHRVLLTLLSHPSCIKALWRSVLPSRPVYLLSIVLECPLSPPSHLPQLPDHVPFGGFPGDTVAKGVPTSAADTGDPGPSRRREGPCRREWPPTPVFSPGDSRGQRSLWSTGARGVAKSRR